MNPGLEHIRVVGDYIVRLKNAFFKVLFLPSWLDERRCKGRWSGSPKALGTAQAPVGAALPGHRLR